MPGEGGGRGVLVLNGRKAVTSNVFKPTSVPDGRTDLLAVSERTTGSIRQTARLDHGATCAVYWLHPAGYHCYCSRTPAGTV